MTLPTHILPAAVYQLAQRPESLPANLRLASTAWAVLFSLSGRHSVAQVGAQLALDPQARDRAFAELLSAELIVERRLSLAEYLRSVGTIDDEERKTFAAFLRGAPARPAAVPPIGPAATEPAGAEPQAPPRVPPGARSPNPSPAFVPMRAPALPFTPFRPLALPEEETPMNPPSSARPRALNLRAMNQLFFARAASIEQAQLDIYRVYLRIDAQLLKAAGIHTLKFEQDCLVDEPELVARLSQSAAEMLGGPLPESVWSAPVSAT